MAGRHSDDPAAISRRAMLRGIGATLAVDCPATWIGAAR
jgi:hypothetical protein